MRRFASTRIHRAHSFRWDRSIEQTFRDTRRARSDKLCDDRADHPMIGMTSRPVGSPRNQRIRAKPLQLFQYAR